MIKYLAIVLLGFMSFIPVAQAEVPSGVLGFMDGKFYDSDSNLKYLCFMDGQCYDLNGTLAFSRTPTAPVASNDEFNEECGDPLKEYDKELAELKTWYNTEHARIIANTSGQFAGGVEQDVATLNAEYSEKKEPIENQRSRLAQRCTSNYPGVSLY